CLMEVLYSLFITRYFKDMFKQTWTTSKYTNYTRPLLCFTADSAPLRALAWAPDASLDLLKFMSIDCLWVFHNRCFAAYGCADGSTVRFQLTTRFVDKDPRRGRTPHFLCGSLSEGGGTFKINTPLPNTPLAHVPFIQKKPSNECRNANRTTIQSNLSDTEQTKGEDSPFPGE
ncbi:hypothetical protein BHE74_00003350, partial [Ensete ventricosum]